MIDSTYNYKELMLFQELQNRKSNFIPEIDKLIHQIKDLLNTRIPSIFPSYTLHDTGHSFRIMKYMSDIVSDLKLLSDLEIAMLIYSALLHDVGMALDEKDRLKIIQDNFELSTVKFSVLKRINGYDDKTAIQEFTRAIHSQLSAKYIRTSKDFFTLPFPYSSTLNFAEELAKICESHTQDLDWIKQNLSIHQVLGNFQLNSQFIAGILRLSDILDIDSSRTPYKLYKSISPKGISDSEWKQHFEITNLSKIETNENKIKTICFYGISNDPSIHRKLLSYLDWVKLELTNVLDLVNGMEDQYSVSFQSTIKNKIDTVGFTYSDYKVTLDFQTISSLLMGEKIYGDKEMGLRELIQNSIDACLLRKEKFSTARKYEDEEYEGHIKIILNKENNTVTLKDNGTGMSLNIIKNHFLKIGMSYYNSNEFKLQDYNYQPIGNYGIGFLSSFMLSPQVTVITKTDDSDKKYTIQLERGTEHTSLTYSKDNVFEGTEVILEYNSFMELFHSSKAISSFIKRHFLTSDLKFTVIDTDNHEKTPVINLLPTYNEKEEDIYKIDFAKYVDGIEGRALIKYKKKFVRSFSDLEFQGQLYIYDAHSKKVLHFENCPEALIKVYLVDGKITYISIPLVPKDKESRYLSALEFTREDTQQTISSFVNELLWVSILFPPDFMEDYGEMDIECYDDIFDYFESNEFEKIGVSTQCKTKLYINSIRLFEGIENRLYIPFGDVADADRLIDQISFSKKSKLLYIRNVLVRDFYYSIRTRVFIFEIKEIIANLISRKFIPDISRNNIDSKSTEEIAYIIYQSILNGIIELWLDPDEREALRKFKKSYYP